MKKYLGLFILLAFSFAILHADDSYQEISAENGFIKAAWSPFQLAFVPEKYWMLVSGKADIYGIAVGIFFLEQESATVSVAVTSGQHKNYGLQCAAVTMTNLNYGVAVGPVISFVERNFGLQIGVVNAKFDNSERHDHLKTKSRGMQIGVFNIGEGFQIGVLNYNPKARVPILPVINFPCKK